MLSAQAASPIVIASVAVVQGGLMQADAAHIDQSENTCSACSARRETATFEVLASTARPRVSS